MLPFSTRVETYHHLERVIIRNSVPSDSGAYSCAVGPNGYFSEIIHIRVIGMFLSQNVTEENFQLLKDPLMLLVLTLVTSRPAP